MNTKQLSWIKKMQREHKKRFGSYLHVDFAQMKGLTVTNYFGHNPMSEESEQEMENYFFECCREFGADPNAIRTAKKLNNTAIYHREKDALEKFCKKVVEMNWNKTAAGKLINKDRSNIHYYATRQEREAD